LLHVECQPCGPLRLAGRGDGYRVEDLAAGRLSTCLVLIGHVSPSFRRLTAYPLAAVSTAASRWSRKKFGGDLGVDRPRPISCSTSISPSV